MNQKYFCGICHGHNHDIRDHNVFSISRKILLTINWTYILHHFHGIRTKYTRVVRKFKEKTFIVTLNIEWWMQWNYTCVSVCVGCWQLWMRLKLASIWFTYLYLYRCEYSLCLFIVFFANDRAIGICSDRLPPNLIWWIVIIIKIVKLECLRYWRISHLNSESATSSSNAESS